MATSKSVESWKEAKETFEQFSGDWIFRGHLDAEWELETSLYRWMGDIKRSSVGRDFMELEDIEKLMLEGFKKGVHHYLSSSLHLPKTTLEWLSLMQHYGAPTRLLDFTRSPYVASFFAFEEIKKVENCAVWAVNESWCKKESIENFNNKYKDKEEFKPLEISVDLSEEIKFNEVILKGEKLPCMVFPVCPKHLHKRLINQQGLFLCPGDLYVTFNKHLENLLANAVSNIKKIIMPIKCREDAIKDLELMNINSATLFSGLDGYVRSLRNIVY